MHLLERWNTCSWEFEHCCTCWGSFNCVGKHLHTIIHVSMHERHQTDVWQRLLKSLLFQNMKVIANSQCKSFAKLWAANRIVCSQAQPLPVPPYNHPCFCLYMISIFLILFSPLLWGVKREKKMRHVSIVFGCSYWFVMHACVCCTVYIVCTPGGEVQYVVGFCYMY